MRGLRCFSVIFYWVVLHHVPVCVFAPEPGGGRGFIVKAEGFTVYEGVVAENGWPNVVLAWNCELQARETASSKLEDCGDYFDGERS
ncbi:hypothetical protein BDD12DRAFT_833475 [Trichophaea hybrida]|nr:hypothetical protein BDD12DRAFT_833475 [Trichophaea hybrida]